jgi:NitT/TauT family transport system ATP-binding protein
LAERRASSPQDATVLPGLHENKTALATQGADDGGTARPGQRGVLVSLRDIHYCYADGAPVISGCNLELRKGEVVSLVGPSGCGKSTLLSVMAGLRQPTVGQVSWDEFDAREDAPRTRTRIGLVFQKDTLLPWLTVERNIAFGLRHLAIGKAEKRDRLERLLALGSLTGARALYPYQLSGGMRRRTALLMAVAPTPKLLLLDEPFSALDEPTRISLHQSVLDIVYELGMTMAIVTHDLGEAISLGDVVHILSARPSSIVRSVETEFGHRRRDLLELRETEEYLDLYKALWHSLRQQIQTSSAAGE